MRSVVVIFVALMISVFASNIGAAQPVFTYKVKGVIKFLPGKGTAANEIMVKHEPIPDYRDEAGNVVGMAAMTMPFYLAKGVSIESLAVGDKVEMVVEQRIKPRFSEEVVSLTRVK